MQLPPRPRILIVKLSAVGDVVHALPTLNALRAAHPDAHIGWVCHPGPANLLEGHPQLDELIVVPRRPTQFGGMSGFRKIVQRLKGKEGRWDVALDLQGLTKSGLATLLSGARWRIGFGNQWSRELNRLFMNLRVSPKAYPVMQMNIGLAEPIGVSPAAPVEAVLHTTPADDEKIRQWAAAHAFIDTRFLLLDPFAGWQTKLWEPEKWLQVAEEGHRRFGLRPIVFHGPGELEHAEELAGNMSPAAQAVVAPETSLREYISLLRLHVAAVVAADTGPMHIAAAVGLPTVALFGPSDNKRNGPNFHKARFVALQDPAQPCTATNARVCQYHAPGKCMSTLTPEQVLTALGKLLGHD